jgi:hypothetical protein
MGRGLSHQQVDTTIHLYNLGWSLAQVGQHLGIDHTTVLTQLRERGVPTRGTHGRPRGLTETFIALHVQSVAHCDLD